MDAEENVWAGLDVAKAKFDAALAWKSKDGELSLLPCGSFPRDAAGAEAFAKSASGILAGIPGGMRKSELVMEATGSYSEELARMLDAQEGFQGASRIVNPRLVHHYARSLGMKNETDRIAASLIARFGFERKPPRQDAIPDLQASIRKLARGRADLVKTHTSIGEQLKEARSCKALADSFGRVQLSLEKEIKAIELQTAALLKSDGKPLRDSALIDSIPGVGFINACATLGELGDLRRFKKRGQLIASAGLNCISKESGPSVRRCSGISKAGPAELRRVLYLAARASINASAPNAFALFYAKKIKEGRPKLSATTAVMRKILLVARALLLKNEAFSGLSC